MSKHVITLTIELDDSGEADKHAVLLDLASNALAMARDDYRAELPVRQDGYSGPFLTGITAEIDGQRFNG